MKIKILLMLFFVVNFCLGKMSYADHKIFLRHNVLPTVGKIVMEYNDDSIASRLSSSIYIFHDKKFIYIDISVVDNMLVIQAFDINKMEGGSLNNEQRFSLEKTYLQLSDVSYNNLKKIIDVYRQKYFK